MQVCRYRESPHIPSFPSSISFLLFPLPLCHNACPKQLSLLSQDGGRQTNRMLGSVVSLLKCLQWCQTAIQVCSMVGRDSTNWAFPLCFLRETCAGSWNQKQLELKLIVEVGRHLNCPDGHKSITKMSAACILSLSRKICTHILIPTAEWPRKAKRERVREARVFHLFTHWLNANARARSG